MAEHTVSLDLADMNRYSNDEPFHTDEEYNLLRLLETWWKVDYTQQIPPVFYLTDKKISHDLSLAPAIKVHEIGEETVGIGLGYIAKKKKLTMNIEIITLDRTLLFDTKDEVIRILDFCRKNPIPGWDFIYNVSIKRMDPRAGNYHIIIQVGLERLVEPIPGI